MLLKRETINVRKMNTNPKLRKEGRGSKLTALVLLGLSAAVTHGARLGAPQHGLSNLHAAAHERQGKLADGIAGAKVGEKKPIPKPPIVSSAAWSTK